MKVAAHCDQRNSRKDGRSQQLGNKNRERRTQYDREIRQSQIAEMTPVRVVDHRTQHNSQESGRSEQLGNDNRERSTQDEAFRVASLNSTKIALFNLRNTSNQHTYQNTQDQSTTGIYPEFAAYISDFLQSFQKVSK